MYLLQQLLHQKFEKLKCCDFERAENSRRFMNDFMNFTIVKFQIRGIAFLLQQLFDQQMQIKTWPKIKIWNENRLIHIYCNFLLRFFRITYARD